MSGGIPQWAKERAANLSNGARSAKRFSFMFVGSDSDSMAALHAFAAYIADHEKPPADPLEDEAYRMASTHHTWASAEECDKAVSLAVAALKRGFELAQSTEESKP